MNIDYAYEIMRILGEAYIVGGFCRDSLLDREPHDIDIATPLNPTDVIDILKKNNIKYFETGISHGTVTVVMENETYEVTSFRRETSNDGRHATCEFSTPSNPVTIEEDAMRRDFTINAIYKAVEGDYFSPVGGVEDLKNGHLRFVGSPQKRIEEDYLRILRYFRFAIQYNFEIDSSIVEAMMPYYKNYTNKVAWERTWEEMKKISNSYAINIIPSMIYIRDFFKSIGISIRDKADSSLNKIFTLENFDIPIYNLLKIESMFNTPDIRIKIPISKNEDKYFSKLYTSAHTTHRVKFNSCYYGFKETIESLLSIYILYSEDTYSSMKEFKTLLNVALNFPEKKFPLTGQDLLDIGIKEGKIVGNILKEYKKIWAESEGKLFKEELINMIKENYGTK